MRGCVLANIYVHTQSENLNVDVASPDLRHCSGYKLSAQRFLESFGWTSFTLYDWLMVQSTPDNSNLQGKSKKVRVIGSSNKIAGGKEKTVFTAQ